MASDYNLWVDAGAFLMAESEGEEASKTGFWLSDVDRLASYRIDLSRPKVLYVKEKPMRINLWCKETTQQVVIEV